ncbi:zinc transporter 6-like [Rhopilema esculentum]|uniref:zinc transporter 6-like n=1 Tax=Rhopilema esculentum TaxID=499914 RepID=UPI0031E23C4C
MAFNLRPLNQKAGFRDQGLENRSIEIVVDRPSTTFEEELFVPGTKTRSVQSYDFATPQLETMKPFRSSRNKFETLKNEFRNMLSMRQAKKIAALLVLNFFCTFFLIVTATATNSMALTAFAYLTIFDFLCLCTCFLSIWISQQVPTKTYSFGFDRFEILAVFVSTTLTQLGSFFILKESFEGLFQYQEVKTNGQLPMMLFGLFVHLIVIYGVVNRPFSHVSNVAASNPLQEFMQDFGKNICGMAPILSKYLLPRLNPYALLGEFAALMVLIEVFLVDQRASSLPDTICAMIIAFFTCVTMFPLGAYSGMILLQAAPGHMMETFDKLLREANTIDGVLEIKNEHVWNVGFERIACSFHVRVRRDAIEQLILAEITHRLSPFLHHLTIQIFKDERSLPIITYGEALTGQSTIKLNDNTNMFSFDFEKSSKF